MTELKPCPFCGGEVRLALCDSEGNPRDDDYLQDPYSGVGYHIVHSAKDIPEEKTVTALLQQLTRMSIWGFTYITPNKPP